MQQLIRKSLKHFRKSVTYITFFTYNIVGFMVCYGYFNGTAENKRIKNEQV